MHLETAIVLIKYKIIKVSSIKVEDVALKALWSPEKEHYMHTKSLKSSVYYQILLYLM